MASSDVSGCAMEPPDPPVSQPMAAPLTDAINGPMVVTTTRSGDVSAIGSPAPASEFPERGFVSPNHLSVVDWPAFNHKASDVCKRRGGIATRRSRRRRFECAPQRN